MKVKDLFNNKTSWTRGVYAKNSQGETVNPLNEEAVSWCLEGAIMKCYPYKDFHTVLRKVEDYVPEGSILQFNDNPNTKFEDVRKVVETLDI